MNSEINRDFYLVLAADNAAIVRLLDDTTGLPPIEDVRVFIVDDVNFPPSLALFLNATGVHIVFSDDGARRLFLLHRDDARELLSRTRGSQARRASWGRSCSSGNTPPSPTASSPTSGAPRSSLPALSRISRPAARRPSWRANTPPSPTERLEMASFDRTRLAGLWTAMSPLLHTEMEDIDDKTSKALNAEEGGVWAPSTKIEIGGAGIKITGLAEFTGEFKVTTEALLQGGATVSGGPLAVSQDATIQGDLTVSTEAGFGGAPEAGYAAKVTGNCKVTGTCSVTGDLLASSGVSVQGAITAQGNITGDGGQLETLGIHSAVAPGEVFTADGDGSFTGDLGVGGALAVTGATTLTGTVSIAQPVTPTGSGRVRVKAILGADADTTYNAADAQCIHIPSSVSSTTRTYTIGTTGASDGDRISFSTDSVSKTIVLNVQGSNPMTPNLGNGTGAFSRVELTYIGSGWYITSGTLNP